MWILGLHEKIAAAVTERIEYRLTALLCNDIDECKQDASLAVEQPRGQAIMEMILDDHIL